MPTGNGEGTKKAEAMYQAKQRSNKDAYPDKGTKRYAQNEKIINSNSALKKARDVAQGLAKPDSAYGDTSHGKGSAMRGSLEDYKAGYDQIKWTKQEFKEKPKFKTRINGVVVSDPENDNE